MGVSYDSDIPFDNLFLHFSVKGSLVRDMFQASYVLEKLRTICFIIRILACVALVEAKAYLRWRAERSDGCGRGGDVPCADGRGQAGAELAGSHGLGGAQPRKGERGVPTTDGCELS